MTRLVGQNLNQAIREHGLSNRQVGEAIGATETQVSRWRNGRGKPSDDYLVALAKALGVSVASFYADTEREAA